MVIEGSESSNKCKQVTEVQNVIRVNRLLKGQSVIRVNRLLKGQCVIRVNSLF